MHKPSFQLGSVEASSTGVDGSFFDALLVSGSAVDGSQTTPVQIVNVHLRPPLAMGGSGGLWANLDAYFRTSGPIHKAEIAHHLSKFPDTSNTLVVGDFNEGAFGGGFKYLEEIGFCDALSLSTDKTTWYWPAPVIGEIWGSYDHIFYPPIFEATSCVVMKEYKNVSDHLPVLASFRAK